MASKEYCAATGTLFSLVSLAHLLRIINGLALQIGEYAVPMLVSWIAFIVTASLATWAFRLARQVSRQ